MKYINVSEYTKLIGGLHRRTIIRHFHAGRIKGKQLETGTILLEDPRYNEREMRAALYVTTSGQEIKLQGYAHQKGYKVVNVEYGVPNEAIESKSLKRLLKNISDYDILLVTNSTARKEKGLGYTRPLLTAMGKCLEQI